uniref:Transmembrane protein n=1 Tax=Ascaris lumbricoides TaxID=6252 RepID=A0A0M3IW98_ASCLU
MVPWNIPLQVLLYVILVASFLAICYSLCANTGTHCHDTGCRLHGGHCNSACICVQRQTGIEALFYDSLICFPLVSLFLFMLFGIKDLIPVEW